MSNDAAALLRRAFDDSFARSNESAREPTVALLEIRVGSDRYAFRLSDAAGVYADHPVVAVPGSTAALRGITSIRGTLVPVYDLGAVLGNPPAELARWFVWAKGDVALAFDQLVQQFQAPVGAFAAARDPRAHIGALVATTEHPIPVIDAASVIASITHDPSQRGGRTQ